MEKIKGKKISRNVILKGEAKHKKKFKPKRPSTVNAQVRKTFSSGENFKNESKSLSLEGDYDHLFKEVIIKPAKHASKMADFWVEVKYRIHSIVRFNLRQIKFSTGIELIWTDSQLTLCDCTGGNHTGHTEMDSADMHRWVWTPDFSNWLHKSWNNEGVGLRDRPHQLRMTAVEGGVSRILAL